MQLTSWSVISPPTPSYLRPLRISRPTARTPSPSDAPPSRHQAHNVPGENHVLKRVAAGAAAAGGGRRSAAAASQPIAIGNGPAEFGQRSASPMESDDDTFGMSRSWDDIEGARRRRLLLPNPSFPVLTPPLRARALRNLHRFCAFRGATRSILYLNSPQNGFHPAHALPPGNFRLSSTAAASSAPSTFHISFGGTAS